MPSEGQRTGSDSIDSQNRPEALALGVALVSDVVLDEVSGVALVLVSGVDVVLDVV